MKYGIRLIMGFIFSSALVWSDVGSDILDLKKMAELGDPEAQYNLGAYYNFGHGGSVDYREAVSWYRKAAEQGVADAQYNLGVLYDNGDGVHEDHVEATRWYMLAADQNLAIAQYNLGVCFLHGTGVPKDSAKAYKWFLSAAEQGKVSAQYHVAVRYLKGDGVSKDIKEAVKWYLKSAEQGFAGAQYDLGLCYDKGNGVPQDYEKAAYWYTKAAEQGYIDAQLNLGNYYSSGTGLLENDKKAVRWYRKAAEQGRAGAQFNLGLHYADGKGVEENQKEAVKWYRLAAEQGDADAQCNLGYSYSSGEGVLEDYVEAYAWYLLAAMNGSEVGSKNKEILKESLSSNQISKGQDRAKGLLAVIERKQHLSSLSKEQVPSSADIAPAGFGSGLLVNGGYVLTCWHVIDGSQKVAVSVGGKDYVATVAQKDPVNDIAVLKVEDAGAGVSLSFSDKVSLGEQIFTMGYPHPDLQGSDVKFTTGTISSLTGLENSPRYFQISVPVQSGNSGGPLFDEYGNLVGIVAAKLDSLATVAMTGDLPQNVNYAIKADYLVPLLKAIDGLDIKPSNTKEVNLLELIEELKQSVVMIKVY